jgi:hypothetical protein
MFMNIRVLRTGVVLSAWTVFASDPAAPSYPPRADLAEVRAAVDRAPRAHPRVLVTADQLRRLREPQPAGSLKRLVADNLVRKANGILDQPPITHTLKGRRLLGQSRRCVERVLCLATAFHLTGDVRYARRCEREMLAAAAFPDWNPKHFLDVGEMACALGIGYDWLFDQLPESSRRSIRTALVEKALSLPFGAGARAGWIRARNNWGQVCHGGLTIAALAVLEDEPDLAAKTVLNALRNVPRSMAAYAPKGSYPEGPGYWAYGTTYNVLLIAALESALGGDYGLSRAPGFDQTGGYPALVTGPSGYTFNYADGGSGRHPLPALFWFAARYHRPDWLYQEFDLLRNKLSSGGRFLPLVLFWMRDTRPPDRIRLPLHWYSEGAVPISIHRSSWKKDGVFLGFKGGSPRANHGQMDTGSFVLDAEGVRWALDLGAEGYYGIESRGMNLWSSVQNSDRWTIFRQMNLGHNTLVIDGQLQKADGFGKFIAFSDDPAFPHSVVDLTSVYEKQVRSVRRGVALLPSRAVLVQDELTGLRPGAKVRWGMITPGKPGPTGRQQIELRQKGVRLTLRLLSPAKAVWETVDTAKPRHEWDSPNPGTVMVQCVATAPADGTLRLAVLLRPGNAGPPVAAETRLRPLAEWR